MRWISVIALSLALAATAADDLAGKYTAFGEDPRARAYYAYDVEITPQGEVYKVTWYWEDEKLYDGVGVVLSGLLCVGYAGPVGYGVNVYKMEPDGALKGVTALPGNPGIGWENLHRKESGAGGASDD